MLISLNLLLLVFSIFFLILLLIIFLELLELESFTKSESLLIFLSKIFVLLWLVERLTEI